MTINTLKMPNRDKLEVVGLASTYDAGTFIAPHIHTAHQVVHAISGTMRVSVQNKIWFVPPRRAMWIPAQTTYSIECVGRVKMRTAYLSETYPLVHANVTVIAVSHLMREILIRLAEGDDSHMELLFADVLINEIRQGALQPLNLPIPSNSRIAKLALHLQTKPADQTTLEAWAKRLVSGRKLVE